MIDNVSGENAAPQRVKGVIRFAPVRLTNPQYPSYASFAGMHSLQTETFIDQGKHLVLE